MRKAVQAKWLEFFIYAKTEDAVKPNDDFNIGRNRISLGTLDLNRDWSAITEQLDNLCGWLTESTLAS